MKKFLVAVLMLLLFASSAFADAYYVEKVENVEEIYKNTICIFPDNTFAMFTNLYVGMGFLHGTYQKNGNIYTCVVQGRDFKGFIGDDVDEFKIKIEGDTAEYLSDDYIGMVAKGMIFGKVDSVPISVSGYFDDDPRVGNDDVDWEEDY
jgi:hypothetical protein